MKSQPVDRESEDGLGLKEQMRLTREKRMKDGIEPSCLSAGNERHEAAGSLRKMKRGQEMNESRE